MAVTFEERWVSLDESCPERYGMGDSGCQYH